MAETDSAESLVTAAVQSDQCCLRQKQTGVDGRGQTGTALTRTRHGSPDQGKLSLPAAAFAEAEKGLFWMTSVPNRRIYF